MSVLVKGMKMPENCETCKYQTKGACFASGINKGTITIRRMDKERPDWCPLVEIKMPHGRLFDETEVKKCLHELPDSEDKWGAIALLEWAIEKRWCIEAEDL